MFCGALLNVGTGGTKSSACTHTIRIVKINDATHDSTISLNKNAIGEYCSCVLSGAALLGTADDIAIAVFTTVHASHVTLKRAVITSSESVMSGH